MRLNKAFIAIFGVLLFATCAAIAVPPKLNPNPSDYHTGISWKEAQKINKPIAVNFYVDWCGACRRFAPVFEEMRQEYGSKYSFVIIKTDDPKNKKLVREFNIQSFPSMFLVDKKKDKQIFINQRIYLNKKALREEFNSFLSH